jgi:hypothetical protein
MTTPATPSQPERAHAAAAAGASIAQGAHAAESARAHGLYRAQCVGPIESQRARYVALRDRIAAWSRVQLVAVLCAPLIAMWRRQLAAIPLETKWQDRFTNLVTTEGKNAALTHFLKGSSYTASQVLGLIEDTGYSAVAAGNTAASITAAGSGSPANGWNEAPAATCASRGTPSFATASGGTLATSASVSFSIIATDTIKGAFLLCRSTAGVAPSATVGNTSGALYSAGLFSGGDRAVANGDTLNVTYTASL